MKVKEFKKLRLGDTVMIEGRVAELLNLSFFKTYGRFVYMDTKLPVRKRPHEVKFLSKSLYERMKSKEEKND